MARTACIAIPTRGRPAQLATTLASIAQQAAAREVEIVVVDDGPDDATRDAALRYGATYLVAGAPGGPNAARNRAFDATSADLVILLDDDIRAWDGWLDALLAADAEQPADVAVLAGPIIASLDPAYAPRSCGRHGSWVTELDEGDADCDLRNGWSANMAVRRDWYRRAGPFDEAHAIGGDEEEWTGRVRDAGGRIRYIAAAGV
ncbi:MAG: glycosyltransferase, partial [Patulibacter sp.]